MLILLMLWDTKLDMKKKILSKVGYILQQTCRNFQYYSDGPIA